MNYQEALKAFGKIAIQIIEAQGMQAGNMCAQAMGAQSLPYPDAAFCKLSDNIGQILKEMK